MSTQGVESYGPGTSASHNEDQNQPGGMFRLFGCDIELPDPINGYYIQMGKLHNEKPKFMRQTNGPDSDPMMIWFTPKKNLWMVNNLSQFGTENAKAVCQGAVTSPTELTNPFYVYDPAVQQFTGEESVTFRVATPAEIVQNRQQRVKLIGRTGYNRAMNGIYHRGPGLHSGHSYYKHEKNDFSVRWFQSKWVVDWRPGLNNDNVGAAVCKEEVPEPWMCTIPWRVYDGKAPKQKWHFDPKVKVLPEIAWDEEKASTFE